MQLTALNLTAKFGIIKMGGIYKILNNTICYKNIRHKSKRLPDINVTQIFCDADDFCVRRQLSQPIDRYVGQGDISILFILSGRVFGFFKACGIQLIRPLTGLKAENLTVQSISIPTK